MKTYTPSAKKVERAWHLIDAENAILGRLATEIAELLRGKKKAIYTPNIDTGDHVVVINAAKVGVSADKRESKIYYRHSGYPGSLRERTLEDQLSRDPTRVIYKAVEGMLPKNRLGRQMVKKLHVYPGPDHKHSAQDPKPYELGERARLRKKSL